MNEIQQLLRYQQIRDQAVMGLASIAIQYIMDEDYDKAENTLRGMIMTLEGTRGEE
jgi:hypothetical protein|tara:strand:- start:900 stop:1067 length:168 start_codon:yes stop_codon:yes gene_type:complete